MKLLAEVWIEMKSEPTRFSSYEGQTKQFGQVATAVFNFAFENFRILIHRDPSTGQIKLNVRCENCDALLHGS